MPSAQGLRLITQLEDFIHSYQGDTGNPHGGGLRSQVDPHAAELVRDAEALRSKLVGTYGSGDASSRNTPGSQAAKAASTGGDGSPGVRARQMMGATSKAGT